MGKTADTTVCPHEDTVLLDGKEAKFFGAKMTAMPGFDLKELTAADYGMRRLGLPPLGDMVCSIAPQMVIRAYGMIGRNTLGYHVQQIDGEPYIEFFSLFDNGASLTTTTQPGESYPDRKIFRHIYAGMDPSSLYERHFDGITALEREHKTQVRQIEPTLRWAAEAIDDFLVRFSS